MSDVESLILSLVWKQLQACGCKRSGGSISKGRIIPIYGRWFDRMTDLLVRHDIAGVDVSFNLIKRDGNAMESLLRLCIEALPAILTGEVAATNVLFPDGSMELVEGIYKNNTSADAFNEVVSQAIVAYVKERVKRDSGVRLKFLEVGAGTGGTSAALFRVLRPYQDHIDTYLYTDVSKAFLQHAEREFLQSNSFLKCRIFDVESPETWDDIGKGAYDVVIAANVLHATKDIRKVLRHVKATLKNRGWLLLNEIDSFNIFSHLTFGLLEGWWLYEDLSLRIPGSPALSAETWIRVLKEAKFSSVHILPMKTGLSGQQIIIAESDGVIRHDQAKKENLTFSNKIEEKEAVINKEGALELIKKALSEAIKLSPEEIEMDTPFEKYGIDSILQVNFLASLEKVAGNLPKSLLFEYPTTRELSGYLEKNCGAFFERTMVSFPQKVDNCVSDEVEKISYELDPEREKSTSLLIRKFLYDDPIVQGHRINGKPVLVGAIFPSLVFEALEERPVKLCNLVYHVPIAFELDEGVELKVDVEEDVFRIIRISSSNLWDTVAAGNVEPGMFEPKSHDLSALKQGLIEIPSKVKEGGVAWGDCFKTLRQLFVSETRALCRIDVAPGLFEGEQVNPLITNSAYLVMLACVEHFTPGIPFLPTGINGISLKKGGQLDTCWLSVECLKRTDEFLSFDVEVIDESGDVWIYYEGYSLKLLPPRTSENEQERVHLVEKLPDCGIATCGETELENNLKRQLNSPGGVVPLNSVNQGHPVFWFHGSFGGIDNYASVAQKINRPFFGVEALGTLSFNRYMERIQAVQGEGPYDLGGFSLGGLIAYEVARKLQEKKEHIRTLVMIDTPDVPEIYENKRSMKTSILQVVNSLLSPNRMISREELDSSTEDEEFFFDLIKRGWGRGIAFSEAEIREKLKEHLARELNVRITNYKITPLPHPEELIALYLRNESGSFLGELAPFVGFPEDELELDQIDYWKAWENQLPNFHLLDVNAPNHMRMFEDHQSREKIGEHCAHLYEEVLKPESYVFYKGMLKPESYV